MKNFIVNACVAAIVCLAFVACGKSQSDEGYIGMKMNAKLIKNIVAEFQLLKEMEAARYIQLGNKGELMAIGYGYESFKTPGSYTRLYNKSGEMVTELNVFIHDVGPFVCGLSRIDFEGTIAYINTKGEFIVPSGKYASGSSFWHDIATVRSDEWKWGVIRKDGSELFPLEYEKAEIYPNGLLYLERHNNQDQFEGGIFKADGTEVLPFQPMSVEAWKCLSNKSYLLNDVIIVKTKADGFCSIYGDGRIEKIGMFYDLEEFDEHKVAQIRADFNSNICGFINADGKLIIPCEYLHERTTDYGIVMGNKDNKIGVFDFDGNVLWPFDYDDIGYFNRELACVTKDGQWNVIDHDGHSKPVAEGTPVFGKCYQTRSENGCGLATLTGEELLAPTHSWFEEIPGSRLVYAVNDKEFFNFDTGIHALTGVCQMREDYYEGLSFDPDGFGIFSSRTDIKSKNLYGADGGFITFNVSRIGAFYVGGSAGDVYYKGKEIANLDGLMDKPEINTDPDYGYHFLDGIFVYSFDHKGRYTTFINKKGVVAKIDGYVSANLSCFELDITELFISWMNPY